MRIIGKILCLFGKHKWRYYHRWNGVISTDGKKVQVLHLACNCGVHRVASVSEEWEYECQKGEGTSLTPEHIDAARRLLEKQQKRVEPPPVGWGGVVG